VNSGLPFAIVDVFADAPLQGDPLAVVADGDTLAVEVMHRIAAEFGFSETTFCLSV
jgi:PhzF family phenazine biosynthesis protein